jgi:hypothetical protein
MTPAIRILPRARALSTGLRHPKTLYFLSCHSSYRATLSQKCLSTTAISKQLSGSHDSTPPTQSPPPPSTSSPIGQPSRLPEFSLSNKIVLVSGAARGLGLVQAEALLEAGATVYALDRLETPDADFARVQKRAEEELGTRFEYRRIDVTDQKGLNEVVGEIADTHGGVHGLIAAAGIQQETSALEYTAEDAK